MADVAVDFQAAPEYTATLDSFQESTVLFSVQNTDARQLQYSMMYMLGATYGLSGLLYLLCYALMRRKQQHLAASLSQSDHHI